MKEDVSFVIKASLLYCALAATFSLLGIFLAEKGVPHQNPIVALSVKEIGGHLLWGLVAGAATLSLRYTLLGGSFAVLIDSDHLIGFAPIDSLSRMGHSIAFGAITIVVILALFGKRNYLLAATAFAAVFAHMSYDTFAGKDGQFPLLTPFYNQVINFPNSDWIFFEIVAVALLGTLIIIKRKKHYLKIVEQ